MERKFYFVCCCGAKWFAAAQELPCPRCGQPSHSTCMLVPPWLNRHEEPTSTHISAQINQHPYRPVNADRHRHVNRRRFE